MPAKSTPRLSPSTLDQGQRGHRGRRACLLGWREFAWIFGVAVAVGCLVSSDRALASSACDEYERTEYRRVGSAAFADELDGTCVEIEGQFLGEWTLVSMYKSAGIEIADRVFVAHRDVGFDRAQSGLTASELPPFPMSVPVARSEFVFRWKAGQGFRAHGLLRRYPGVGRPWMHLRVHSIEAIPTAAPPRSSLGALTDEQIKALKGIKELLDMGIITQTEFDERKASILTADPSAQTVGPSERESSAGTDELLEEDIEDGDLPGSADEPVKVGDGRAKDGRRLTPGVTEQEWQEKEGGIKGLSHLGGPVMLAGTGMFFVMGIMDSPDYDKNLDGDGDDGGDDLLRASTAFGLGAAWFEIGANLLAHRSEVSMGAPPKSLIPGFVGISLAGIGSIAWAGVQASWRTEHRGWTNEDSDRQIANTAASAVLQIAGLVVLMADTGATLRRVRHSVTTADSVHRRAPLFALFPTRGGVAGRLFTRW